MSTSPVPLALERSKCTQQNLKNLLVASLLECTALDARGITQFQIHSQELDALQVGEPEGPSQLFVYRSAAVLVSPTVVFGDSFAQASALWCRLPVVLCFSFPLEVYFIWTAINAPKLLFGTNLARPIEVSSV
jgi:hypothetical protein